MKLFKGWTQYRNRVCLFVLVLTTCLASLAMTLSASVVLARSADMNEVRTWTKPRLEKQLAKAGFELGQPIFIRIYKESSELEVWLQNSDRYSLFKTYEICNFSGRLGPKLKEGDLQSPEGFYYVTADALNPNSRYHLSFNLGFPNAYDRSHKRTGSYLMVHGDCVSIGCYAMTDRGIEEIYLMAEAALGKSQKFFRVQAFPFRMTDENLERHKASKWIRFWKNMKTGADFFDEHRVPPDVTVTDGRYTFAPDV